MTMAQLGAVGLSLAAVALAPAQTQLVFEAENVAGPATAWKTNSEDATHWNLWSTDRDAAKKWSGGIVLRSPVTKAERPSPEDGAPPLHVRIPNIKPGRYSVEMKGVRTLAVSRDGKSWEPFNGGVLFRSEEIRDGALEFWVDDRFPNAGDIGPAYVDTITLTPWPEPKLKPRVDGHAKARVTERLDRGLVALPSPDGAHLSWRLLHDDPPGTAFHAYRADAGGKAMRITDQPIALTTDFTHKGAALDPGARYFVRAACGDKEGEPSPDAVRGESAKGAAFLRIRLDGTNTFQKAAVTDLDGDGRYDFVIKTPNTNIDPYIKYWKPSPGTYKIEARRGSGELLWRNDLGWGIEQGIWYSPYIAGDLDGDGKAEVVAKIGEGDPRDPDGRVTKGPEWLVVWDGLTGKERARAPWPDRSAFGEGESGYNYASRNQLAIAFLDGRTPCLIVLRGTYTAMRADAYDFDGKRLRPLWTYSDAEGGPDYRGQGAHFTHAADIDGDGRDEIILGSAVIDDNGSPLWSTWLGHPDHCYVGDIDPARPGLEIYYGIEKRQSKSGMCLVDAPTGKILWGWDKPTKHIHGHGLCSDIDPAHPGSECYGADSADHKPTGDRWLWSAQGEVLSREIDFGFGVRTAYWDADPQRELLLKNRLADFGGNAHPGEIEGSWVLTADVFGDWREEIIFTVPGEIRIYSTTIPARDRRVALIQDPIYRADVTMCTMGYPQVPMTSYDLASTPAKR
ncbi:MAG TPA: silent information regulator protein Sir2 [Verrucomicrobiae bacterium]|nr:silent information regulator protein Sir2 [Verrucomicrobiae bacterium]